MNERDDNRIVDYLYDELSKEERAELEGELGTDSSLEREVTSLSNTLSQMRALDEESPSPHLDALILAAARTEAERIQSERSERGPWARIRRLLRGPGGGLIAAASLAALAALVLIPTAKLQERSPASQSLEAVAQRQAPPPAVAGTAASTPKSETPVAEPAAPETLAENAAADDVVEREDGPAKPKKGRRADDDGELAKEAVSPDGASTGRRRSRPPAQDRLAEAQAGPKDERASKADAKLEARGRADPTTSLGYAEGGMGGVVPSEPSSGDGAGSSRGAAAGGADVYANEASRAEDQAATPKPSPAVTSKAPSEEADALQVESAEKKAVARQEPAPKTSAPGAPPSAPSQERSFAESSLDEGHDRAAAIASDMIRVAEARLARGDKHGARAILAQAQVRTRGTPSFGTVSLRWARLELAERRYLDASRLARLAASTPGFPEKPEAERLVLLAEDLARQGENAPAASPPAR